VQLFVDIFKCGLNVKTACHTLPTSTIWLKYWLTLALWFGTD